MTSKSVPSVSVIMPVYNGQDFLRVSVGSILQQTLKNLEFIIIDDGSTDNTMDVLSDLAASDDRIRLLRNPIRKGIAKSLNQCAKMARARLLARMDVDDRARKDRFDLQLSKFEKDPNLVVCGSNVVHTDAVFHPLYRTTLPTSDLEIRRGCFLENPFAHSSVMIRAVAFEAVGGYCERFDVAQDYELWNRLLTYGTAYNIVQPLMELRRHQESVSTRLSGQQIDTACAIQASICGDLLAIDDFSLLMFKNIRTHLYWDFNATRSKGSSGAEAIRDALRLVEVIERVFPATEASKLGINMHGRCLISILRSPFQISKAAAAISLIRLHGLSPFKGAISLLFEFLRTRGFWLALKRRFLKT
jgi:glycosyltransferase involved in cell wall biosynthesis